MKNKIMIALLVLMMAPSLFGMERSGNETKTLGGTRRPPVATKEEAFSYLEVPVMELDNSKNNYQLGTQASVRKLIENKIIKSENIEKQAQEAIGKLNPQDYHYGTDLEKLLFSIGDEKIKRDKINAAKDFLWPLIKDEPEDYMGMCGRKCVWSIPSGY